MEELTWALRSAQVGIKGGALLLVATVVLFAAGLGADGFLFTVAALLIVATYVTIFFVALKSAIYYKGDARVEKWASNLFLLAGILGCAPIVIAFLLRIPFLGEGILWLVDSIFSGGEPFTIIFQAIWIVGILSIVSGIGYAVCLKNFKE